MLEITDEDEPIAADDYEVDDYRCVLASLGSGVRAWVHVSAAS
jgi:hypothetical protein